MTAGNDHRLGANEAPPAVISVYLGERLTETLQQVEAGVFEEYRTKARQVKVGVATTPNFEGDDSDRNRTSPFAFTGNKFEFRACGSSQSCSEFNTYLNVAVAESLDYISDQLESFRDSENFGDQLQLLLSDLLRKHKRIVYNGNNYSQRWLEEAKRRGLPNLTTALEALTPLLNNNNHKLMERYGIFSSIEMESRYEIYSEEYLRKIQIEGEVLCEIAQNMILPVALESYNNCLNSISQAQQVGVDSGCCCLRELADVIGKNVDALFDLVAKLSSFTKIDTDNCQTYVQMTNSLRQVIDTLEEYVDDSKWPLPKYREMLFVL
ncbi:MAG: hypothetical protein KIG81_05455 [Thermoguttaceae bacterium]|nr:hypothetical protein [Thermoguttaceae bacterium]